MPTATELLGRSLVNLGPLTTTFTAPASCTPTRLGLADTYFPHSGAIAMETCGRADSSDCFPAGKALDADYSSSLSANASTYIPIYYYSPAYACPAGWATVGTVVKNKDGQITSSWAFAHRASPDYLQIAATGMVEVLEWQIENHIVWGQALGPRETGIACCPSGYLPMVLGGCYSVAPKDSYTATTACQTVQAWPLLAGQIEPYSTTTLEVYEETVTFVFVSLPVSEWYPTATNTWSYTFTDPSDDLYFRDPPWGFLPGTSYAAYYTADMVLLATGGSGQSGDGDDDNAAERVHGGTSGKIALILGAWVAAMMVGGAMVVPL